MKMNPTDLRTTRRIATTVALLSVLCCLGFLAGCGTSTTSGLRVTPPSGSIVISGHVHGGQQPVSGSIIQLYAVGIGGSKSAATPLIGSVVATDQNGAFNITGDWNCTSDTAIYGTNPLLYIVASGGDPGIGGGTNNAAIELIAALGPCSGINAYPYIEINELTTVAAVYALAPFMADFAHIGAQGANPIGLVNAFKNAGLLVNIATGAAPGSGMPSNGVAPIAELNSLADIVAACVNSSGVDGTCATLFSAATPSGGTAPTDISGVLRNIAANPANNVSSLLRMIQAAAPFQPALAVAPKDWTVALTFTGGGLLAPAALALDAAGNVWVANAASNGITELSSAGAPLTGTTGYMGNSSILGAKGIAVDRSGNVWVANTLIDSVVKVNLSNGVIQSSASYNGGGIDGPTSIAIDSHNDVWIANFAGGSVTELDNSGQPLGNGPLTANGQRLSPLGIAVDIHGDVWVTDNQASLVFEYSNSQQLLSTTGYADAATFAPTGIALDASGRAWVADSGTDATSVLPATPNTTSPTPFTAGGLSSPSSIAIDGVGTAWVANNKTSGSISELFLGQPAPLSPATGLGTLNAPAAIAIDASGSIWTANAGDSSVSEFIGLAAPATMPIALNAGP